MPRRTNIEIEETARKRRAKAVELRLAGKTYQEIGAHFGVGKDMGMILVRGAVCRGECQPEVAGAAFKRTFEAWTEEKANQ